MRIRSSQLSLVLGLLPPYLTDVHALLALLCTSHHVRSTIASTTTPHLLLTLLSRTRSPSQLSDPLHLLSIVAPGLSAWLGDTHNRRRFVRAVRDGAPGINRLARRYPAVTNARDTPSHTSPLSLASLAEITARRREIAASLSDLVDKCAGVQWYATPNFWDGGAEDAATIWAEPDELLWRWVGYGATFGSGVEEWYAWLLSRQTAVGAKEHRGEDGYGDEDEDEWRLPDRLRAYEVTLRCEFVKYVLPDWHVPLEKHRGHGENGVRSMYPYPGSLAEACNDEAESEEDAVPGSEDEDAGSYRGGASLRESSGTAGYLDENGDDEDPVSFQAARFIGGVGGQYGSQDGELDREDNDESVHTQEAQAIGDPHVPDGSVEGGHGQEEEDDQAAQIAQLLEGVHIAEQDWENQPEPTVLPTVHPLRATHPTGPYKETRPHHRRHGSGWVADESEHISALLHLFERSPLFRRLARQVRYRAIRIAHAQDDTLPRTPAQDRLHQLPRSVQAVICAKSGYPEFGDLKDWKQVFWEDALWTAGWDGLELLHDVWERDGRNVKARLRRGKRESELAPCPTEDHSPGTASELAATNTAASTTTAANDGKVHSSHTTGGGQNQAVSPPRARSQIPDDHPGLQRLARIYAQLCRLDKEPKRVEFESIDRPQRKKVCTWLGPVMTGDLRCMQWSGVMGWTWEMR